MSRIVQEETVVETAEAALAAEKAPQKKANKAEKYLERVAKYIPSEIVAAYVAALGVIAKWVDGGARENAYMAVFVLGLVATPLYLSRFGDSSKSKTMHLVISTIAFVVWAYSLGGAFKEPWQLYNEGYAELAAIIFAMIAGFFVPGQSMLGLKPKAA